MRLIDADIEVESYVETWDCSCSEYGRQRVMSVDDLEYLPTIDPIHATGACYCRECKYFKYGDYCTEDKMEHSRCRPEDFCSYGARIEEDSKTAVEKY